MSLPIWAPGLAPFGGGRGRNDQGGPKGHHPLGPCLVTAEPRGQTRGQKGSVVGGATPATFADADCESFRWELPVHKDLAQPLFATKVHCDGNRASQEACPRTGRAPSRPDVDTPLRLFVASEVGG